MSVQFDTSGSAKSEYRDYRLGHEPRGDELEALLSRAGEYCDRFLVALSGMELSEAGNQLLERLTPFLIQREETNHYPAATLPWGTLTVCTYRLDAQSRLILSAAAHRLFQWVEPDLPNDLCLLRGEQPWLVTMASDRVAIVTLDERQRDRLRETIPALRLLPIE